MKENLIENLNLTKMMYFLSIVLSISSSQASWNTFKSNKVFIDLKSNWHAYEEMLGLPLVYVGAMKKDREGKKSGPIFTITPTGITEMRTSKESFDEKINVFKRGRTKWVNKLGGKIHNFQSLKTTDWKNIKSVKSIQYKYTLDKTLFIEKTYYFYCKDQLFHAKSLVRPNEYPNALNEMDEMLSSFKCKTTELI